MMVDQVRAELLAIKAESADGLIHTQVAVDWAKQHPTSGLYARLDWDDASAGNSWRNHQMRHLIRYHVVSEVGEPEVISLQVDRASGGGYRDRNEARTSMSQIMLREALRSLKSIRDRYDSVRKLQHLWVEIDRAVIEEMPPAPTLRDLTTSRAGRSPRGAPLGA